jgi:cell division protein FtsB
VRDRRAAATSPASTAASPASAAAPPPAGAGDRPQRGGPPVRGAGLGLTRRALALVAVLAVLGLSYSRSFTLYLAQQREIQQTQADNDARRVRIEQLEDEVARWSDPDYVRAQARERLGWVMPGEIGYRVIGADGVVLGADTSEPQTAETGSAAVWYEALWASVKSADLPLPETNAEAIPEDQPAGEVVAEEPPG